MKVGYTGFGVKRSRFSGGAFFLQKPLIWSPVHAVFIMLVIIIRYISLLVNTTQEYAFSFKLIFNLAIRPIWPTFAPPKTAPGEWP